LNEIAPPRQLNRSAPSSREAIEENRMNWRVIVKMSFTGRQGSTLRYRISKRLAACGLRRSKMATATWEGAQVPAEKAAAQLSKVLELLSDPSKANIRRAQLDHLWVYIDRSKPKLTKPVSVISDVAHT
jgi:hypothetical protein